MIQTYTPKNEIICFAARQDYLSFYRQELPLRRLRGYPPFADVIVLTASGLDEGAVLRCCIRLRQALATAQAEGQIFGPAPAAVAKINNRYRYRLTITGRCDKRLRELVAYLLRAAQQDKENRGVAVFADWNPYES